MRSRSGPLPRALGIGAAVLVLLLIPGHATADEAATADAIEAAVAEKNWERVVELAASLPSPPTTDRGLAALNHTADALTRLDRKAEAAKTLEAYGAAAQALGSRNRAAAAYQRAALYWFQLKDLEGAQRALHAQVAILRAQKQAKPEGRALMQLGGMQQRAGAYADAEVTYGRLMVIGDETDDAFLYRNGLKGLEFLLSRSGRIIELVATMDAARARLAKDGPASVLADIDLRTATHLADLGRIGPAIERAHVAARAYRKLRITTHEINAITILGRLYLKAGRYSDATAHLQTAIDRASEAPGRTGALLRLDAYASAGYVHAHANQWEAARDAYARALEISTTEARGRRGADLRFHLATAHGSLGEWAKAEALLRPLKHPAIQKAMPDRYTEVLFMLARAREHQDDLEDAIKLYTTCYQSIGQRQGQRGRLFAPTVLLALAQVKLDADQTHDAETTLNAAASELPPGASRRSRAMLRAVQSRIAYRKRSYGPAAEGAQEALQLISTRPRGLTAFERAGLSDEWRGVVSLGVAAAWMAKDWARLTYFLEVYRARALVESLRAGDALHSAAVPEALRSRVLQAEAAERNARDAYLAALARGATRKQRRALKDAHNEAQERLTALRRQIRREATASVRLVDAMPDGITDIRARLAEDEALVLLARAQDTGMAMVVYRSKATSVIKLCAWDALAEAAANAFPAERPYVNEAAIPALRACLVDPLEIPKSIRTVLIAPVGRLAYVPFQLLMPERTIAYVPSATAHGLLLQSASKRGNKVLALGDPDYLGSTKTDANGDRGGRRYDLRPLPNTRVEAKAVGDDVLLGAEANETALREALGRVSRWRAVHLACHGFVNPVHPDLSTLALTPTKDSDGYLDAIEVFRLPLSADLVVLSACETARGRAYEAEGLMGLTQAFMLAGAPRVICSLWKVDDRATAALMTKFYELWNPKEGKGLGAAESLRRAQEHVKAQEQWKHPYYWGAWTLWGLPK